MGEKIVERRYFPISELRAINGDENPIIEGHPAVFNRWSEDLGGFREKIAPGAFKRTLKEGDVRGLFNHDPNYVLGRTKSGTLELREDKDGLHFTAVPPDTQWARDLHTSIKRGDIDGGSFGFEVLKEEWQQVEDGPDERTLLDIELFDVGPVTFPAYPDTEIQARAEVRQKAIEEGKLQERSSSGDNRVRSHRKAILESLIQTENLLRAEEGMGNDREGERTSR